jgi:uncharacterized protein DUF6457
LGVDDWLGKARDSLASACGDEPAVYTLEQKDMDELLDLARIAAHESGERINAPLVCYLVGIARGRHGTALDDLIDAVISKPLY